MNNGDIRRLAVGLPEGAAMIGIAPRTLRKMATERRVPSVKLGGRLLFRVSDLEALLEKSLRSDADLGKAHGGGQCK